MAVGNAVVVHRAADNVLRVQRLGKALGQVGRGQEKAKGDTTISRRVGHVLEGEALHVVQVLHEVALDGAAVGDDGVQTRALGPDQGPCHLGEAIVLPANHVIVVALRAVLPEPGRTIMLHASPIIDFLVVCGHEAALASGDDLVLLKAEAAHPPHGSQGTAFVTAPVGLGHVFYHVDVVFLGHGHDLVHAGVHAPHVYGHDGFCMGRDLTREIVRVHVQGIVDLGDDGHGSRGDDGRRRGDVRVSGNDDLVSGTGVDAIEGADQGRRPRVDGQGILAPQALAVPVLYLGCLRLLSALAQEAK